MLIDIRHPLRITMLVVVLIVAFGVSSASYAQSSIPADQAKAFVRAALAVSQVHEVWQVRIDEAKSEVEAERLREKSIVAIRQAIREIDGMTVHRYRSLYYDARRDPELAAYLNELLEQEVAGR